MAELCGGGPAVKKAVFLDRDGVLIEQVAYLSRPEQVALIPGAVEALKLIHRHGDVAVVISNQSGKVINQ